MLRKLFAPFGTALEEVLDAALDRFFAKWGVERPAVDGKAAAVEDKKGAKAK